MLELHLSNQKEEYETPRRKQACIPKKRHTPQIRNLDCWPNRLYAIHTYRWERSRHQQLLLVKIHTLTEFTRIMYIVIKNILQFFLFKSTISKKWWERIILISNESSKELIIFNFVLNLLIIFTYNQNFWKVISS